jgi:GR25 family glycosyltransferase involved in LPS biosynthesis
MLNARLNLLRQLFSDADYPAVRYAVSFHDKPYAWVLSHEVAAQLYEYIRRHWHLATDDEANDPLDDLRRSAMLQGPVGQSAGPWYAVYCRGQVAKNSIGEKIEQARCRYVLAAAEITCKLWEEQLTRKPSCPMSYAATRSVTNRCSAFVVGWNL